MFLEFKTVLTNEEIKISTIKFCKLKLVKIAFEKVLIKNTHCICISSVLDNYVISFGREK